MRSRGILYDKADIAVFCKGARLPFFGMRFRRGLPPLAGQKARMGVQQACQDLRLMLVAFATAWRAGMAAHLTGPSHPTRASRALLLAAGFDCQEDVFALPPAVYYALSMSYLAESLS